MPKETSKTGPALAPILGRIEAQDTAPLPDEGQTSLTLTIDSGVSVLHVTSNLAATAPVVFEFCRVQRCFQAIFPERITMIGEKDAYVVPGGEFRFVQWMFNVLPMPWRVEIQDWVETDALMSYTDVQRSGPLGLFEHRHICEPLVGQGCRYTDALTFKSGFGGLADRFVARPYMVRIFQHRHRVMRSLLGDYPTV